MIEPQAPCNFSLQIKLRMPRLKVVSSLAVLSNGVVSRDLANACFVAEKNQDSKEFQLNRCSIESYLLELPSNLLESVVLITVKVFTNSERLKTPVA